MTWTSRSAETIYLFKFMLQTYFFLTGRILSIAWNTSLEVILTGGVDNMRLWSVKSGHAVQRMTLGRVEKSKETIVWCVAILRYCMKKGKLNMVM